MKEKKSFPEITLAALLTVVFVICKLIRISSPFWVLPELNIPNMVLLCGLALLLDHLRTGKTSPVNIWMPILAAVIFGLLPFAAGFAQTDDLLKLAIVGAVVFTVCAWVYDSMQDRLASGPAAKAAPVLSVLVLYLAAQCFAGILL